MKPRTPARTPKAKPDPRNAPIEIELSTVYWQALLRAAEHVQYRRNRTAGRDQEEEHKDTVRAAAIDYLRRVTATEYHTLRVRMGMIGACVLAQDAFEIAARDRDLAINAAGHAIVVAASRLMFLKEDEFE